jgi:hypothetical protein
MMATRKLKKPIKKAKTSQKPVKKSMDKLFDEIIIDISENAMSCISALKGRMSTQTFYELLKTEEKAKRYTRACEMRADIMADEILTISDNRGGDIVQTMDSEYIDHAVINRDRLRVDSRKWLLSKLQPKKYGDKIDVEHSGNVTLLFDSDDANA